ncbi:MAG TPA: hypothetical protein VGA85_06350 [Dehalococcoidales bacterium]
MIQDNNDKVTRAYATLISLRKNIGEIPNIKIPETFVREYHNVLDNLQKTGVDLIEFRVPDSEVQPVDTAMHIINNGKTVSRPIYTKEKYVDKPFLLTKLDAILGYFARLTADKPRSMGFRKPDET